MADFDITAVEYPVDTYPPINIMFDYNEGMPNFLRMLVDDEPGSNEIVRVFWTMRHKLSSGESTIPQRHDHIISLGCEGYALLLKSIKVAHQTIADMASLRTLIAVDFSKAETALDWAQTTLAAITTATTGELAKAEAVWTDELKSIADGTSTIDASDFVTAGQARLNKFNKGREVPQQYAQYAQIALDTAQKWADKRRDLFIQAEHRVAAAGAASAEAAQWIAEQQTVLQQATHYINAVTQGVTASQAFRADGLERITRFTAELKKLADIEHTGQKSQRLFTSPWLED